jgi:hypothetical protein
MQGLFEENDNVILSIVYPMVMRALRTAWLGSMAATLEEIIAVMGRANPALFEPGRLGSELAPDPVRIWLGIAAEASRRHPQLDINSWATNLRFLVPNTYEARPQRGNFLRADSQPGCQGLENQLRAIVKSSLTRSAGIAGRGSSSARKPSLI